MQGEKQDFVALTTLRAIGALCVVEHHAWFYVYPAWPMSWFVPGIQLWPDYFFVLSGFILTHVYGQSLQNSTPREVWSYFVARVARVYPLHLFVLGLLILFELIRLWISHYTTAELHHPIFAASTALKYIPSNLLLVQAWGVHHSNSWNDPAWSVSAEFACYLIFPLMVKFGVARNPRSAVLLVLFSCAGLLWIQVTRHTFDVTYDLGVPRAFFSFSLGCVIRQYLPELRGLVARFQPALVQLLTLAAIVALFAWKSAKGIYFIPLWVLLIVSLTFENTWVARGLSAGPLVKLGDISYSIYMMHILILWVFLLIRDLYPETVAPFLALPPPVILACFLGATTAVSFVTYAYVENPGRRFVRKQFGGKRKAAAPAGIPMRPASEIQASQAQ